jgi:hypothetical protein
MIVHLQVWQDIEDGNIYCGEDMDMASLGNPKAATWEVEVVDTFGVTEELITLAYLFQGFPSHQDKDYALMSGPARVACIAGDLDKIRLNASNRDYFKRLDMAMAAAMITDWNFPEDPEDILNANYKGPIIERGPVFLVDLPGMIAIYLVDRCMEHIDESARPILDSVLNGLRNIRDRYEESRKPTLCETA